MKDNEIKLIEARCRKAVGGPWISFIEDRDFECGSNFIREISAEFKPNLSKFIWSALLPHIHGLYWWIQSEPQVIELIAFKCDDF